MAATPADARFAAPDCLFWGLGAEKAGTTWLHDYLASHPQVKVPGFYKEQQYWNAVRPPHHDFILPRSRAGRLAEGLRTAVLPRLKRDAITREWAARQRAVARPRADHRDHAEALFAGWAGQPAVGEITPSYALLGPATLAEMAALNANARFFFVMRDPVGRAVSAARMHASLDTGGLGLDAAARLERAIAAEDDELLARSDYRRTLRALDEAVPAGRVALFFYETLFDQAEIDRLCAHLGVAPHPARTGRVVFSTSGDAALPETTIARLAGRLAPVYDAMETRFGANLPQAWRRDREAAQIPWPRT